jgi:hypothetical protein
MKNEQIKTETYFQRMRLLMQLHKYTCWLIIVNKPTKEKLAIWYKDNENLRFSSICYRKYFEKLIKELARQDQILAKC